ncbi:MAG: FtsW/RodA/SpoVE family cell cycle protein, partial [Phycisphaerae bacterium]|nr:FtsW/RodA/SpoVE family cell cycle protein [Phycisphaerae bacterium]
MVEMLEQIWKGHSRFLRLVMSLAVMALVVIGLVTIYATSPGDAKKQLVWIALSLVGFVAVNLVHYRLLGRAAYGIFILALVLLALVLVGKKLELISMVPSIRGASRWINVIPGSSAIRIQPSEIAKIAYILALAWYLRHRSSYRNLTGLIGPFALSMLPMVLILLEP